MRAGSLFSGYGGLDLAVAEVLGTETAWFAENEPGPARILAHHWPSVPNLGDITRVDWSAVEPVEVLTGGFPCQDVSAAGKRAGLIRHGDRNRSGLWSHMCDAIDILRPKLVVVENVRGLLSAKADASPAVFACAPCVGRSGGDESLGMRALGAVLGDLAELGYDAAWQVCRASDVGAPHQRARVILVAWPADADVAGLAQRREQPARHERPAAQRSDIDADRVALLPTPSRADGAGGPGNSGRAGGLNLRTAATQLLPSPRASDGKNGGPNQRGSSGDLAMPSAVQPERFGKYAAAVEQWETLTRPAPDPTETGPRGGQRLSAPFVEWMMGLPAGHVTSPDIGLTRNEQLKALGNGVVPQQMARGLRLLLDAVGRVAA
jgi:DNA (cytosine-5)-methyltransferase 1